MPVIDADAHFPETPETWDFLDEADGRYRPVLVVKPEAGLVMWLVDTRDRGAITPAAKARLLNRPEPGADGADYRRDVDARLQAMDAAGVDVQVLFPSMFAEELTDKPEIELALCRSYNRWMAEVSQHSKGRLRWMCALPLWSIPEAAAMLSWCKERGAAGAMMRPMEVGNHLLHDPYFDPLYQALSDRNMCVGVHAGNGNPRHVDILRQGGPGSEDFWINLIPLTGALHSVISCGVPERFPELRMGFFGAGSEWVSWAMKDLQRRGTPLPKNLFEAYRLYVCTRPWQDDFAHAVRYIGAANLLAGSECGFFTRADSESLGTLKQDVPSNMTAALLDENARRFYGISSD
ncbi:MAG: amidohydrolase family protein [Chloroflexota bacterium]|mgnify:CR=1 FL=1